MKILLTISTIVLFSFNVSAEYNKKFSIDDCRIIYNNAIIYKSLADQAAKDGNASRSKEFEKWLTEMATAYLAFCKD